MADKRSDESVLSKLSSYLPSSLTALAGNVVGGGSTSAPPRRRTVLWKSFDTFHYRDQPPVRVLLLGLTDGFQVYRVAAPTDVRQVVCVSEHAPISCVRLLAHPNNKTAADAVVTDPATLNAQPLPAGAPAATAAAAAPLGALIAVTSAEDRVSFPRTCVKVWSVSARKWVHMLRFRTRVQSLQTSANHLLVALDQELHLFRVAHSKGLQFDFLFSTRCYPAPDCHAVYALGPRWLAYAANEPIRHAPALSPSLSPAPAPASPTISGAHLPALTLAPPALALSSSPGAGRRMSPGTGSGLLSASAGSASSIAAAAAASSGGAGTGSGNSIGAALSLPSAEQLSEAAKSMASNLYTAAGIGKQKLQSYLGGGEPTIDGSELGLAASSSVASLSAGAGGGGASGSPARVPASPYAGSVIVRDLVSKRVISHWQSDTRVAPIWRESATAAAAAGGAAVPGTSASPLMAASAGTNAQTGPGAPLGWLAFDPSGTLLVTVPVDGQYVSIYQVVAVPAPGTGATVGAAASASVAASGAPSAATSSARDIPRRSPALPAAVPGLPQSSPPAAPVGSPGAMPPGSAAAVAAASGVGAPPIAFTTRLLYSIFRGITHAAIRSAAFSSDSRWIALSSERTTHVYALNLFGGPATAFTHGPPLLVAAWGRPRADSASADSGTTSAVHARPPQTVSLTALQRISHPAATALQPHSAWYTPIIGAFNRSSSNPDTIDDLYVLNESDRLTLYTLRVPMPAPPTSPTAASRNGTHVAGAATSGVTAAALTLEVTERCVWDLSTASCTVAGSGGAGASNGLDLDAVHARHSAGHNHHPNGQHAHAAAAQQGVEPFFELLNDPALASSAAVAAAARARLTPSPVTTPQTTPVKPPQQKPPAAAASVSGVDAKHSRNSSTASSGSSSGAPVPPPLQPLSPVKRSLQLHHVRSDNSLSGAAAGAGGVDEADDAVQTRWLSHAELRTFRSTAVPVWATPQFTLKTYTAPQLAPAPSVLGLNAASISAGLASAAAASAASGAASRRSSGGVLSASAAALSDSSDPNYLFFEEFPAADLAYEKFSRFDGLVKATSASADAPAALEHHLSDALGSEMGFGRAVAAAAAAAAAAAGVPVPSPPSSSSAPHGRAAANRSGAGAAGNRGTGGSGSGNSGGVNLNAFVDADTFFPAPSASDEQRVTVSGPLLIADHHFGESRATAAASVPALAPASAPAPTPAAGPVASASQPALAAAPSSSPQQQQQQPQQQPEQHPEPALGSGSASPTHPHARKPVPAAMLQPPSHAQPADGACSSAEPSPEPTPSPSPPLSGSAEGSAAQSSTAEHDGGSGSGGGAGGGKKKKNRRKKA